MMTGELFDINDGELKVVSLTDIGSPSVKLN